MDLNKLRIQVFEKTGIKIETNDPVFALVALNEAVLSECVEQHISGLQNAFEQLGLQTTQLLQAGDRVKKLLLQMGQTVEEPVSASVATEAVSGPTMGFRPPWRWIGAAFGISVLSARLVLGGQAALGYPRTPAPAVVTVPTTAPSLTAEQALLIKNGEKYARMWSRLDAETQGKILALSQ
jgi:hypothetical protein